MHYTPGALYGDCPTPLQLRAEVPGFLVEQVGVEPTMFTTRERIYSPLQNTPYLQLLQNLMELVTGFEPAYNRFAICSLAFRVTPTYYH